MFFSNKSKEEKQRQAQLRKNHEIEARGAQLERNKLRLAQIMSDLQNPDISANCDRVGLAVEFAQLYSSILAFTPANTLECGMPLSLEWTLYRSRSGQLSPEYAPL